MLAKQWITLGAVSGFFAVLLGAFGGHILKERLSEKAFSIYQIANQYQMTHALALIGLGIWASSNSHMDSFLSGSAFTLGIVLFSGSLYALALTDLRFLGMITPLGGVSFMVGWIAFAFLAWKA
jgi:uncharacterized membrane protein YgdD (TMEM256/DUF423 family)